MQGLDFRKKRGRSKRQKIKKNRSGHAELHFENERVSLPSAGKKIYRGAGGFGGIVVWAAELVIICMTAVLLVAAFGQQVSISGDSMSPVLKNGNIGLVNRLIYRIRKPDRGDIVAFSLSEGSGHYSVKRIVGLPGETVQISDGKLLINGEEEEDGIYVSDIEYEGLASEPVELGEDEYFVIGDNHTASDDSRIPEVGNIREDEIYGVVWFIISPLSEIGPV